jgi:hypothetical protein
VVVLLGATCPAKARSAGIIAQGCESCHGDSSAATVTLSADPPNPEVGQPITLNIAVSRSGAAAAGFYLTTAFDTPGVFEAIEAGTTTTTSGVIHTTPRSASGGLTTFKARWTAQQATGVVFDVFAVSANRDKTNRGDAPGNAQLALAIGCTGSTYYIDQDGDGYGSTDPSYSTRVDCSAPAGYAAMVGDCDDFQASVYPGAPEQCDLKDNDCDGHIDNDVVYQPYCEDHDGDGHGVTGKMVITDCKPSPGFGDCDGDCDAGGPETYPGAPEICDRRDNDCDGEVDEGVRIVCGVGLCARYASGCDGQCTPGEPLAESCNGYDDDCDDIVDNGDDLSLCGAPGLRCVGGKCLGEPDGIVSEPGAGGGTSSAGAPPATEASPGCGLTPSRPGKRPEYVLAALLGLRQRRRARRAGSVRGLAAEPGDQRPQCQHHAAAHDTDDEAHERR